MHHRSQRILVLFMVVHCAVVANVSPLAASEIRSWTDSAGKFKREAELVEMVEGVVTLRLTDGSVRKMSYDKLSDIDKNYLLRVSQYRDTDTVGVQLPAEGTQQSKSNPIGLLQGLWLVTAGAVGSQELTSEDIAQMPTILEVRGDKISQYSLPSASAAPRQPAVVTRIANLEGAQTPYRIDLEVPAVEGNVEPIRLHGVCDVTSETATLVVSEASTLRPRDVRPVAEGSQYTTLQRAHVADVERVTRHWVASQDLVNMGVVLLTYDNKMGAEKPPSDSKSFAALLGHKFNDADRQWLNRDSIGEDMLTGFRSGRYQFMYGVSPRYIDTVLSKTVFGYERDVDVRGGVVLFGDAHVEVVTAEEFDNLPKAKRR